MTRIGWHRGAVVLTWAVATTGFGARAAEWEWTLVPYLWGAGVGLDVALNDDPVLGGDASFADVLDKTEMAAMAHFEGRRGKAGFLVDALYLSLGESTTTAPNPPLVPDGAVADTDMVTGLYEAAGFYRPRGEAFGFDMLLGLRVIDYELELDVTRTTPLPASRSFAASDSFLDGFVGARFTRPFAKRWAVRLRADVGAGDTDLTWNAMAGLGVHFGDTGRYGLDFGYRHLEIELEQESDGLRVESDITFSGPFAGFVFRF